ncbi:hypothetical protein ACWD0B_25930, partial [Streptomyces cellulosae]
LGELLREVVGVLVQPVGAAQGGGGGAVGAGRSMRLRAGGWRLQEVAAASARRAVRYAVTVAPARAVPVLVSAVRTVDDELVTFAAGDHGGVLVHEPPRC